MATNESLVFAGVELNDHSNFILQEFDTGIAPKRWQWISGADSDGALSPEESHYDNAEMTVRVRVAPQASMDAALAKIGTLVQALQEAEKQPLGSAAVWTPAASTKSLTAYVLGGEVTGIPITLTGDDAGWFLRNPAPVVTMKLYRRPFLYGAEVTSAATVTDSNPVQTLTVASVPGDVPAEARLVITDAATQSRRHVEWGLEQRYYATGVPRILDTFATDTITAGKYTFDTGSGTLSVSGGLLVPSSTVEKRLYRTDSAAYTDTQNTIKVTTGAAVTSTPSGLLARRIDASNYLLGYLSIAGASSVLQLYKSDAGSLVQLGGNSSTFTIAASTSYWHRFSVQGTTLTTQIFTADPATGAAAAATLTYTLTGGDITKYVSGWSGMRLVPQATDYRWDDFRIDPLAGSTEVLLDSESLNISGFAGTQTTRAGAYSGGTVANHVVRGTLYSQASAICTTGVLAHVGSYRVKARIYASNATASDTYVRLAWQEGDGQVRANSYIQPPVGAGWAEVDLGMISIPEKTLGTQKWLGRVEAYTVGTSGTDTLDVDYLILIPAGEGYGKARALFTYSPGVLNARDEFAGLTLGTVLNARVAPQGGTWATEGATTDFVGAPDGPTSGKATVQRSTGSDTSLRRAALGTTNYTDSESSVAFYNIFGAGGPQNGVLCRYTDANNYLFGCVNWYTSGPRLEIYKRVATVSTLIAQSQQSLGLPRTSTWYTIRMIAWASGTVRVQLEPGGGGSVIGSLTTRDSDLATGGALASGKPGIADVSQTVANPRYYDDFTHAIPAAEPIAVYSGRTAEIRHDSAIRQDSTGTYYGPVPSYRGGRLYLPSAGSANRTSRIFVKARRNDLDLAADDQIADSTTATLHYVPRYLGPPR